MNDATAFAGIVAVVAASGLAVVVSSRLADRVRVPLPALVLVAGAIVAAATPLHRPGQLAVDRIVTVALVAVLFDGGMHIGRARLRSVVAAVGVLGTVGTLLTALGAAVVVHLACGVDWYVALLVGTAVAPTDPAVVFSVLGRRQVAGGAGTVLEGESGANDPVGIALLAGLVSAGGLSGAGVATAAGDFALQLCVGAAVGVVGGRLLLVLSRRVALPGEGLYPLRSLAAAFVLFGVGALAHGSGYLAVFVAGIVVGDEPGPYQAEVRRFHGALASLGEIAAFAVLGLTVHLHVITRSDVWVPGVVLAAVLTLVVRPAAVLACLLPARLGRGERAFVAFAGLKGAVPILLGGMLLTARIPGAARLYGVVVVVVVVSVVLQGGAVPAVARWLRLPLELVEPQPYAVGVRLPGAPEGVVRRTVQAGSTADGATVADLAVHLSGAQIALLVRAGALHAVSGATRLQAGDEVTLLGGGAGDDPGRAFGTPGGVR